MGVEMTIANQCTGERNHLLPMKSRSRLFLAVVFISYQKIVYLLQIYIIFEMVSFLKV